MNEQEIIMKNIEEELLLQQKQQLDEQHESHHQEEIVNEILQSDSHEIIIPSELPVVSNRVKWLKEDAFHNTTPNTKKQLQLQDCEGETKEEKIVEAKRKWLQNAFHTPSQQQLHEDNNISNANINEIQQQSRCSTPSSLLLRSPPIMNTKNKLTINTNVINNNINNEAIIGSSDKTQRRHPVPASAALPSSSFILRSTPIIKNNITTKTNKVMLPSPKIINDIKQLPSPKSSLLLSSTSLTAPRKKSSSSSVTSSLNNKVKQRKNIFEQKQQQQQVKIENTTTTTASNNKIVWEKDISNGTYNKIIHETKHINHFNNVAPKRTLLDLP